MSEIVANSLDARCDDGPMTIGVAVDSEEVSVTDDGVGMSEEVLLQAIRLGIDMDQLAGGARVRKGAFGLGMKTACASLGRWWTVVTRPVGSDKELSVEFDLDEWVARRGGMEDWWVEVEETSHPDGGPLGDAEHGTAVIVRKLRAKNPSKAAVLAKLGEAYKAHLEQGDAILVEGTPAMPRHYNFIANSKVPIDHSFEFEGKSYRITGWVGLDSQTHNDGLYGFNVYRHKQLIQAWNKEWFAAHLMTSRIIGEVELDFIEANFFKMGVQNQSPLWQKVCEEMRLCLKPIVKASRSCSKGQKSEKKDQLAVAEMRTELDLEPGEEQTGGGGPPEGQEKGSGKGHTERPRIRVALESLVLEDGSTVKLTLLEESFESRAVPWDFLFDEPTADLQTVLNTDSPLSDLVGDHKLLGKLATADCIAHYLIEKRGMSSKQARGVRDTWLLAALDGGEGDA